MKKNKRPCYFCQVTIDTDVDDHKIIPYGSGKKKVALHMACGFNVEKVIPIGKA